MDSRKSTGNDPPSVRPAAEPRRGIKGNIKEESKFVWDKLVFMWLGCFLAALDGTVLVTLTERISEDLKSASRQYTWINSGFFLGQAAIQPLLGRITSYTGRGWGLIVSAIVFSIGNIMCGLSAQPIVARSSGGLVLMIVGRVVAGSGGGGLTAIPNFVSADFDNEAHKMTTTVTNAVIFGFGGASGGVFGGYIDKRIGWKYAFHIQASCVMLPTPWIYYKFKTTPKPKPPKGRQPYQNIRFIKYLFKVDSLGAFTLGGFMALGIAGLDEGTSIRWKEPKWAFVIPLATSGLSLICFYFCERVQEETAIIPIAILHNLPRAFVFWTTFWCNMSYIIHNFFTPIFLQAKGFDPFITGALIAPAALANSLGSALVPWLQKLFGPVKHPRTGRIVFQGKNKVYKLTRLALCYSIIQTTATLALVFMSLSWHPAIAVVLFAVTYFGAAGCIAIMNVIVMRSLKPDQGAIGQSANYAFRASAVAISVTVATVIFQNLQGHDIGRGIITSNFEWALHYVFLFSTVASVFALVGHIGLIRFEKRGRFLAFLDKDDGSAAQTHLQTHQTSDIPSAEQPEESEMAGLGSARRPSSRQSHDSGAITSI